MRHAVAEDARCSRCGVARHLCVCDAIVPVATRTRVVLIRHAQEIKKSSNSARLAHLALPNSTLVDYGVAGAPFDPDVIPDGAWLLDPAGGRPEGTPTALVVLDGTWPQARKMLHRVSAVRNLPRLAVAPKPRTLPRLRESEVEGGMATLEAVARAIALLEGEPTAAPLDALYDALCARLLAARGRTPR